MRYIHSEESLKIPEGGAFTRRTHAQIPAPADMQLEMRTHGVHWRTDITTESGHSGMGMQEEGHGH